MKKLTTRTGKYGPFNDVIMLEDRYVCDGKELPFTVVGQGVVSDAAEDDFPPVAPSIDPTEYQRQRAAEYPSMADYLDGIVKGDQAQVQAYIDACLAVKAKYPKLQ